MAEGRDIWQVLVNMVMNVEVLKTAENFSNNFSGSFHSVELVRVCFSV
jgi:hypothetical protein